MKKAYRVTSQMMRECMVCHEYCSCGYILHKAENGIESRLFVCDECYQKLYASEYKLSIEPDNRSSSGKTGRTRSTTKKVVYTWKPGPSQSTVTGRVKKPIARIHPTNRYEPTDSGLSKEAISFMSKWNGWAKKLRYVATSVALILTIGTGVYEKPRYQEIRHKIIQSYDQLQQVQERLSETKGYIEDINEKMGPLTEKMRQIPLKSIH